MALTRRQFLQGSLAGSLLVGAGVHGIARAATSESAGYRVGIYTRPWDKFDYRIALDAIADAGFKHAGLMTTNSKTRLVISVSTTLEEAEQVGQEVKKRGLKIPSVYGGGIPVQKSLEAGIEGLRKLIDNCKACGAALSYCVSCQIIVTDKETSACPECGAPLSKGRKER